MQNNNIFYNIGDTLNRYPHANFFIVVSSRGGGKTYSTLKYALENDLEMLYIRRTETEIDLCTSARKNPFKNINLNANRNVYLKRMDKDIYILEELEKKKHKVVGTAGALSTMDNNRGASMDSANLIYFDEFIRPINKNKIKREAEIFFDVYETVARNKELIGEKPPLAILTSNANRLDNEIFSELGIVSEVERMQRDGQSLWYSPERGLVVEFPKIEAYIEAKKDTALYRLTRGTRYEAHALKNEFAYDDFYGVGEIKNLVEYTPICAIDDIYIYRHKSRREIYACRVRASCIYFEPHNAINFMRQFGISLREDYFSGYMKFSDYSVKNNLTEYLKV